MSSSSVWSLHPHLTPLERAGPPKSATSAGTPAGLVICARSAGRFGQSSGSSSLPVVEETTRPALHSRSTSPLQKLPSASQSGSMLYSISTYGSGFRLEASLESTVNPLSAETRTLLDAWWKMVDAASKASSKSVDSSNDGS